MMAPTQMGMQMHMLGAMFAPHNRVTFMAMVSYLRSVMEMQVSTHQHTHSAHSHSIAHREMFSTGLSDTKLEALLTLWKMPHLTLLVNAGVSLPTGSIAQTGENGQILPYPMQLGMRMHI